MFSPTSEHSGSVCRCTLCKSLWIRASAKWLKCKCKMTGPGDLPALDVCVRFPWSSGLPLIKEGEKKENIFVPKRRKMNRGICRHKSVSDRLKGWNRERSDTLVGFLKWRLLEHIWKGSVWHWERRRMCRIAQLRNFAQRKWAIPKKMTAVSMNRLHRLCFTDVTCIYCVPPSFCFLLTLKFPSGINSGGPAVLTHRHTVSYLRKNPGTSPCRTFKLL